MAECWGAAMPGVEIVDAENPVGRHYALCGIRTASPAMLRQFELVRRFAELDTPVLICGETGTGKEIVARALHTLGRRAAKSLVTVDCAALPESLAESELFGHERGAFTGADRSYGGRVEAAADGTLFLDEVNSFSLAMQGKLLRLLEAGEFSRVGRQRPVPVNIRFISACNVPLEELVATGRMRADFYYRLNVLRIDLPPLRERLNDIPCLVRHFVAEDQLARQRGIRGVSPEFVAELQSRPWPGNVRELRNVMHRAIALMSDGDELRDLDLLRPATAAADRPTRPEPGRNAPLPSFRVWMRDSERRYLDALVSHYKTAAQRVGASGLPERTLYRKMSSFRDLTPVAAAEAAALEGGAFQLSTRPA